MIMMVGAMRQAGEAIPMTRKSSLAKGTQIRPDEALTRRGRGTAPDNPTLRASAEGAHESPLAFLPPSRRDRSREWMQAIPATVNLSPETYVNPPGGTAVDIRSGAPPALGCAVVGGRGSR